MTKCHRNNYKVFKVFSSYIQAVFLSNLSGLPYNYLPNWTRLWCVSLSAVINTLPPTLFQAQRVRFTTGHGHQKKVLQHMQELVQEIHLRQEGVSHPSLVSPTLVQRSGVTISVCGSQGEVGPKGDELPRLGFSCLL